MIVPDLSRAFQSGGCGLLCMLVCLSYGVFWGKLAKLYAYPVVYCFKYHQCLWEDEGRTEHTHHQHLGFRFFYDTLIFNKCNLE